MHSTRLIIGYDNNEPHDQPTLVVLKERTMVVAGLQFPITIVVNTFIGEEAKSLYGLLTKTDPEPEERT